MSNAGCPIHYETKNNCDYCQAIQNKLVNTLESKSMSSWTDQELHIYAVLTDQECPRCGSEDRNDPGLVRVPNLSFNGGVEECKHVWHMGLKLRTGRWQ